MCGIFLGYCKGREIAWNSGEFRRMEVWKRNLKFFKLGDVTHDVLVKMDWLFHTITDRLTWLI